MSKIYAGIYAGSYETDNTNFCRHRCFFKERKRLVYQINPVFCLMTAGIGFSLLNDPAVKKMDGQMEEWMDG